MGQGEQPFGIGEAQQRSLLRRIARGDQAAREQLLRAYEPLVGSIARRYAAPGTVDYEDCCQEGRIALIGALGAFKPDAGASFGSYAKQWLIGALKRDPTRVVDATLGLEDEEIPDDPKADDGVQLMGEFVGGEESGRDAYLQHAQREFADVLERFTAWLGEGGTAGEVPSARLGPPLPRRARTACGGARRPGRRPGPPRAEVPSALRRLHPRWACPPQRRAAPRPRRPLSGLGRPGRPRRGGRQPARTRRARKAPPSAAFAPTTGRASSMSSSFAGAFWVAA